MGWFHLHQYPKMQKKSKFNQYITDVLTEMDSNTWPVPGMEMHNRSVVYKSIPSIQQILKQSPDTDPTGIINSNPPFAAPLLKVVDQGGNIFETLQAMKSMFVEAKACPVYQGRQRQQDLLDTLIERIERMQKFLLKKVMEEVDGLNLASLGSDDKIEG